VNDDRVIDWNTLVIRCEVYCLTILALAIERFAEKIETSKILTILQSYYNTVTSLSWPLPSVAWRKSQTYYQ